MKNRIEKILREEGIASSKFADEIGVQRSSMSHILSGRNNPSLDVIQRILRKFPHINSDWLVLGVGDMYKKSHKEISLFDNNNQNTEQNIDTQKDEQNLVKEEPEAEYIINKDNLHKEKAVISSNTTISKKITKIMIFYSDGSFEEINNN